MPVFFQAGGADFYSFAGRQFRPLKIGIFSFFAGGIEFSGSDSIA